MQTTRHCITAVLLIVVSVSAQTPLGPGGDRDLESAVGVSENIYVARFISPGKAVPGPTGGTRFINAQIQVEKTLLGELPTTPVSATFVVKTFPEETRESVPETGNQYVVFATGAGDMQEFSKVAVATPELVREVQQLVAIRNETAQWPAERRSFDAAVPSPVSKPDPADVPHPATQAQRSREPQQASAASSPATATGAAPQPPQASNLAGPVVWVIGVTAALIVVTLIIRRRR